MSETAFSILWSDRKSLQTIHRCFAFLDLKWLILHYLLICLLDFARLKVNNNSNDTEETNDRAIATACVNYCDP